jgi:predicted lipid carrier protein YhbT
MGLVMNMRPDPGSPGSSFSPAFLLGLALRPVPLALAQPVLDALVAALHRRHPDILERVAPYATGAIGIDPVDLPVALILSPDPARPRLTLRRVIDPETVAATIRGPLEALIDLAEGKADGDALFFTRRLTVEGDTELVVALRNAIDGADIALADDIAAACGPLAGPARSALSLADGLRRRLARDMENLRSALLAPALARADMQSARIAAVERDLAKLRRPGAGR